MHTAPLTPLWRALHLLALSSLAIAQPLYGVLAAGADFLVAWELGYSGTALLALAILVVPPIALWLLVEAAHGLGARTGRVVLASAIALLAALTAAAPLARAEVRLPWALPIAAVLGIAFAACHLRSPHMRSAVSAFAFSPPVMLIVFLATPDIRRLAVPASAAGPDAPTGRPAFEATRAGVVVVVFDELPITSLLDADLQIDTDRLPGFARLAATSTWYRQASTVAEQTTQAVPAILTGKIPVDRRPATARSHPGNLFTLLGTPGKMNVHETLTRVCPEDLCSGAPTASWTLSSLPNLSTDVALIYAHIVAPPPLDARLPTLSGEWRGFSRRTGDAGPGRHDPAGSFRDFLADLPPDPRGTVSFVHLNLPHVPFQYLPSGRRYGPTSETLHPHGVRKASWSEDARETEQALQRHLLQVGYVDGLVAQLLDRLAGTGALDDTLLVVTADHGAAFRAGRFRRRVDPELPADVLAVPLFVKFPGQSSSLLDDSNVQTIDILPTIAGALGVRVPWPVDGRDLREPDRAPAFKTPALTDDTGKSLTLARLPPALDLLPSATRHARLFSAGDLWAFGPHRELIGRPFAAATAASAEFRWRLLDPWAFGQVDPQSGFLPVQVRGTFEPEVPGPPRLPLAIAVNGEVRATTWSHGLPAGGHGFSAMVPEDAWRPGSNGIELAWIASDEGGTKLLRVAPVEQQALEAIALSRRWFGGESLLLPDGTRIAIRAGEGLRGFVTVPRDSLYLWGWAADLRSATPAERVLVFEDGELALALDPREVWGGSKRSFPVRGASFTVPIPGTLRSLPHADRVRYFALLDGRAAEIPCIAEPAALPNGLFEDRFGEPWLVRSGRLVPIVDGALRGTVTGRYRSGSSLTVSGRLQSEGLAAGSRIVLLRADGSLAADLPLDRVAVGARGPDGAPRARHLRFRVRARVEEGMLPVRVLARTREIASELPLPTGRPGRKRSKAVVPPG
jgi:hypothetical protein